MKKKAYTNLNIQDFPLFYETLSQKFKGIVGAEWDKQSKILKVFYNGKVPSAKQVKQLKLPLKLKFRKKINLKTASINFSNDFEVVTFNPDATRQEIKEKMPDYEEVKNSGR